MSIENTLPNILNNSCFTILNKKFYYFMRFKLYKPNRFQCVFNQNWFNKLYSFFFVKLHKYYMFDDYFQKNIVSCGHSLILMYYTLIWFNCKKNLKFRNGSKKWPNFGIKESKYDIAYRNLFNVKAHLNHQFDLKYERSCLNHYGSSPHMLRVSKECTSNMREIY